MIVRSRTEEADAVEIGSRLAAWNMDDGQAVFERSMLKNVVIVSDAADAKGGSSVVAIQSARLLAQHGLHVRLFAGAGPYQESESDSGLLVRTLGDGLNLVESPPWSRAVQSLWNQDAANALEEWVGDLDPTETVVHAHSFQVNLTASVLSRVMTKGFPLIVTSHDYGLACPYSGFYNTNTGCSCGKRAMSLGCAFTQCNGSRSRVGKAWHLAKAQVQRSMGGVPSRVDHCVFVSEFSRQKLLPYLSTSTPTSIVRNPIQVTHGPPKTFDPSMPLLFVGRLTHEKGGDLFAEAVSRLGVRAQIAGTGSEESRLRAICPEAEFLGWCDSLRVRELMQNARALVFPSRCYEGQPLTVQEAQSVGLPVVTADGNAASGTVEHGRTGLVFRSGDALDLEEKLRGLTDSMCVEMGRAAYDQFWCDPPTPEAHLCETIRVYESVMASRFG